MLVKLAYYEEAVGQNPSSCRPNPLLPLPVGLPCYVTGWYRAEEFLHFSLYYGKPLSAHVEHERKDWFITHWDCRTKKGPICPMRRLHCLSTVEMNRFPQSTVQVLETFTLTARAFFILRSLWHSNAIQEEWHQTESLPDYSAVVGTCSECSTQS